MEFCEIDARKVVLRVRLTKLSMKLCCTRSLYCRCSCSSDDWRKKVEIGDVTWVFWGQRPLVPLLLLRPPFFLIILFLSTTLLTGTTGNSLHIQWPLTSQSQWRHLLIVRVLKQNSVPELWPKLARSSNIGSKKAPEEDPVQGLNLCKESGTKCLQNFFISNILKKFFSN
jgi:hypothetical protein